MLPFNLKTMPDAFFTVNAKMYPMFPDDVGISGGLSQELWLHDNYLIQFNKDTLFYVNIVSREYGKESLQSIKNNLSVKMWFIRCHEMYEKMQREIELLVNRNGQALQIIQLYFDIITTILLSFSSTTQIKEMESKASIIYSISGAKLNGRKWMYEGREITWGTVIYTILRNNGMNKPWQ